MLTAKTTHDIMKMGNSAGAAKTSDGGKAIAPKWKRPVVTPERRLIPPATKAAISWFNMDEKMESLPFTVLMRV
jgi:hypothetical protein